MPKSKQSYPNPAMELFSRNLGYVLNNSRTSSWCYKTFFGGNLENLDFPLN